MIDHRQRGQYVPFNSRTGSQSGTLPGVGTEKVSLLYVIDMDIVRISIACRIDFALHDKTSEYMRFSHLLLVFFFS